MFSKRLRKVVAVFFVLVITNSIVTPTISLALTAGPTAPEATSFEPVDTTDLVDVKTGDFTYNIPLIEVPGPAGGYPLSLSYHAGIQPDQEASWTGLGFNLNPGSISRLVNGYPDDHDNVTNVDRSFWEGGATESYTVGLSVGIANVATVSAGLSFAQDTYRGYGTGWYGGVGIGYKLNEYAGVGINATFGMSPYGDSYSSTGISLGVSNASKEALNASANIGLSINSNSQLNAGAGAGIGIGRGSLLDASIGTNSSKPSLSVGGATAGVYNSRADNVSINSEGFQVDIPVYYGVNLRLGRNYQRYWIDESEGIHTFGTLHLGDIQPNFLSAFDTYDLLDTNLDIADHNDAERVLGGSFPDVDSYTVTGQGVSGNIRPYHYQQHLYRQDKKDASNKVLSKSYRLSTQSTNKPVEFRFVNDFSNRLEYNPGDFNIGSDQVSFDFDGNIVTGKNGNDGFANNHLAGSKHIEWYTNQEILLAKPGVNPFEEGFINCTADGFQRDNNLQAGGFSITNSSGVTYHYALPAYSYNEFMKSVNSTTKQEEDGLSFNSLKKPEKYAYTWYLTAVTGPDFVDRNSNGLADKGDWGYWVNFEYKKWLSDYKWRNPGVGTNRDVDGEFEFYSSGNKEIYYLDKIVTETHVAVFEKSERLDGREVTNFVFGGFAPQSYVETPGKQQCLSDCEAQHCNQGTCNEYFASCVQACSSLPDDVIGYIFPRPMLKLDRIKLYTAESYAQGLTNQEKILREIDFSYDYTLAEGTPNSYSNENFSTKQGKLTLKSLAFKGKKAISLVPPMSFSYKNVPYVKEKVDVWGFYKNDFTEEFRDATNDIIGRETTAVSALDVDAWSLNRIFTSLGSEIKIEYESDQYEDVVLSRQQVLRTKEVVDYAQDKLKITFWEQGIDLSRYFQTDQTIEIDLVGSYKFSNRTSVQCNCDNSMANNLNPSDYKPKLFSSNVKVDQVDAQNGYIIVSNHDYYNWIKNETKEIETRVNGPFYPCDIPIIICTASYSGLSAWPDYFPAGVVSVPEKARFGGGLRVKSIGVNNLSGDSRETLYEYEGGTTSYEPYEILAPKIDPEYAAIVRPLGTKLFYKKAILKKMYKQIAIARQLPGPGVMYKSVTVREKNNTSDGVGHILPNYTRYEFETYQEGMVDVVTRNVSIENVEGQYENVNFKTAYLNKVEIKDFSSRVGNLKSITLYNAENEQPVSKTINHYLHDDLDGSFGENVVKYEPALASSYSNQGLVEETFSRARIMLFEKGDRVPYLTDGSESIYFEKDKRSLFGSISKMETFPNVPKGQTNINFKTGIKSSTQNLAFDFYSGEATEVLTTDSYGNRYLSKTVPAYHHYDGMGLKVYNKANRNMLTQSAEQYSFVLNTQSEPTGVLSASVQTWSDHVPVLNVPEAQANVWRKQSSFLWNGQESILTDGSYPIEDFNANPFSRTNPNSNSNWEKVSELTLYDTYSHGLEAQDINGNFATTRMNESLTQIIASAANSTYNEMAFSGAEYSMGNSSDEGGVNRGLGNPSTARSHTGKYSMLVGYGNNGFNLTLSPQKVDLSKTYHASVWVYVPGEAESQENLNKVEIYFSENGVEKKSAHPILQKNKSKSWYLLNLDITPDGSSEVFIGVRNGTSRGIYMDDFRVHPIDATLSSFVYDSFSGELNFILDANNFYTKFEYDAMGRLIRTSKELLNFDFGDGKESFRADAIIKETKYNYGKTN